RFPPYDSPKGGGILQSRRRATYSLRKACGIWNIFLQATAYDPPRMPEGTQMHLARFPRIFLAHLPTPLERLDRLSKALGGSEIWIKRDDCTGLSTGGNKTRKLEFLMAEAEATGADTVLTQGATQSNHARQTAAFAARMGMACHLLLEDRTGSNDPNNNGNGNVLLDLLHGATTETRPGGADMQAEMEAVAGRL